jgi:endonuclease/exonuclease/phosphatase family metal-dependent hydrolase
MVNLTLGYMRNSFFSFIIFLFSSYLICAQEKSSICIMFYNTENLFDTINDPNKNDEDFLPYGIKKWNSYKYKQKLNCLYKVILAVGNEKAPDVIALCEVENEFVLKDLLLLTPLKQVPYAYIHFDSPDNRGIDVALIYNNKLFKNIYAQQIPIILNDNIKTRDILYVVLTHKTDTFHFFINHWPSRRGDKEQSELKRIIAAQQLKKHSDSLLSINNKTKIIIVGDFNDEPHNKSISEILNAKPINYSNNNTQLFNLSYDLKKNNTGTIKYKTQWYIFDQIIISKGLLDCNYGYCYQQKSMNIFNPSFLLIQDNKYLGLKPFSSYNGRHYTGGYSDHLPVYMLLE